MGNSAVRTGKGYVYGLLAIACLIVAAAVAPDASAAGKTYYASPTGSGAACSSAAPCKIEDAVGETADGDRVALAAGEYGLPFGGLTIENAIDFGGAPGAPAVLNTNETTALEVLSEADSSLHDLRIQGQGS